MPLEPESATFDLTREPWVPVQRGDGHETSLSLRDVFDQAENLRRVVGDVPTVEFALLRLLLAILHDAIDGPADIDEWQDLWDSGLPVKKLHAYLDEHHERLDLLHPRTPFLQTPGLRTARDEISPLDKIVADVPNGARFFTMRAAGVDRLSFAEAARWLVHAHAFDTSGIKTGAVGDPRVKGGRGYPQGVGWAGNLGGVLVAGANLRETLLLNLVAFDTENLRLKPEHDRPAWRQPVPGPAPTDELELSRRPYGPRDLYTWPSRRIRLHADDQGVTGVVLAYGDPLPARNMHEREPMTAWRRSPVQEKKLGFATVYLPREHDPSRSAWRGLGALVTGEVDGAEQRGEAAATVRPRILDWVARLAVEDALPPDFPVWARLYGAQYGTQQSVIDEIIDDAVAMPIVVLRERDRALGRQAVRAVTDADTGVRALGWLAANLAQAAGDDPEPAAETARDRGYALLDGHFRQWLFALDATARDEQAAQARRAIWQDTARRLLTQLGADLCAMAGDEAWAGRVIATRKGQTLWLNTAQADLTFRAQLRKALPGHAPPSPAPEPQEAGR
ncbi:MAG TPA: type I-E CRISPR-associated protein Cse1/CasA [Streptosporangiaceae bacterium]